MEKLKITVEITGQLDIPVGDITYFDAAFNSFQAEFPECNFKYSIRKIKIGESILSKE